MMRNIVICFIIFLGIQSVSAQNNKKFAQDTIIWKRDSSLVKDNFKAKHPTGNVPAQTATSLFIHSELKGESLLFYVEAIFSKSKSYMKEDSPYVLKHEQLHFDISEVYARKLRQLIIDKDFKKVKNVVEVIQKMANKVAEDCGKEQSNYDKDTEHGINSAKQHVWNEKIEKELNDLEKYSSSEIDLASK
jgi:hypothetical protein